MEAFLRLSKQFLSLENPIWTEQKETCFLFHGITKFKPWHISSMDKEVRTQDDREKPPFCYPPACRDLSVVSQV